MRKLAATILTVWVGVLLASPASAKGTSNPIETIEDVADGIDFVNSGSGSTNVDGPRGTAWTAVTLVKVTAGSDVDFRAVETLVRATTDHEAIGVPKNFARGQASMVRFATANGPSVAFPQSPLHGESYSGRNEQNYCVDPIPTACVGEQLVQFPVTSLDGGTIDWDGLTRDSSGLLGFLGAVAGELSGGAGSDGNGDLVVPLPTGSQPLRIGTGSLIDGVFSPAAIRTSMHRSTGAHARLESSIENLVMFDGLSSFQGAGPGSQTVQIDGNLADAETKLAKVEQMTVLQTDALLDLLGLDSSQLPDETLAQLADALGIHTGRFAQSIAGAANWKSVKELQAGVASLRASVLDAVATGAACDVIDDVVQGKGGFDPYERAEGFGIDRPDCLGLTTGAVDRFVNAIHQLQADLNAALVRSVGEEAILSLSDLSASVKATASVADDDLMQGTGAAGGIQRIRAGGVERTMDVLGDADLWNGAEADLNTELNAVLGIVSPLFHDVVRVRLMPRFVEEAVVEGDYLRSHTDMTLMKVLIDLPSVADVEQAAAALVSGAGGVSPSVGGGGGGAPGLVGRPVAGRADVSDPIEISIGELSADAWHTNPGRTLDVCREGVKTCKSAINRTNSWDPKAGWGPGSGSSSTNLPRTGGASGNLPIAAAGVLMSVAVTFRRCLARAGRPE
ncbi:MAG TPA: hypothetical protein VI916_06660 [Acidimicrobiia bacterium]|nr:hypothetical protein [Acidimicrobiia bacterium]